MGCLFLWYGILESVLDRFDLEYQLDVIAYVRQTVFNAEVLALDLCTGCRAALILFVHRIDAAIERVYRQCDGLGNTRNRQVTFHAGGSITLEMYRGGFVCNFGEFRCVEKIWRLQMFITLGKTSADRSGFDSYLNRAGFCRTVQVDFTAGRVETSLHGREAQVADTEMREGVGRIYRVTIGSQGGKRQRDTKSEGSKYKLVHGCSFRGFNKSNKRINQTSV